jgi:hypothetical protein
MFTLYITKSITAPKVKSILPDFEGLAEKLSEFKFPASSDKNYQRRKKPCPITTKVPTTYMAPHALGYPNSVTIFFRTLLG